MKKADIKAIWPNLSDEDAHSMALDYSLECDYPDGALIQSEEIRHIADDLYDDFESVRWDYDHNEDETEEWDDDTGEGIDWAGPSAGAPYYENYRGY